MNVTVTTPGGVSATSLADDFTYMAVTAVSPVAGALAGGTSVTITGTGFTGATAVQFGGVAAETFDVVSSTEITATTPAAESTGAVNVTVTGPGGTTPTSTADQFTYEGVPTVTSVAPTAGPLTSGTSVTITGTGLAGATAVDFGSVAGTIVSDTATQIVATAPAATTAGVVNITVTTPVGTSTTSSGDEFTYTRRRQLAASAPLWQTSGTSVTITGTNFTGPRQWISAPPRQRTGRRLGDEK